MRFLRHCKSLPALLEKTVVLATAGSNPPRNPSLPIASRFWALSLSCHSPSSSVFHSPYWLTRYLGPHAPGAIFPMCLSSWFRLPCQLLRLPWSHIWWPPLMPPHFPSPLLFIQSAVQKSSFPVLHLLSTEESPNSLASLGSRLCPRHCVTSSRQWQNMKL